MVKPFGIGGLAALSLCLLPGLGCDEKPATHATAGADAGARSTSPVVDPNIAAAVREVAKAPLAETAGGGSDVKEPPPNGVFAAGEADKEMAPGSPPKLTLGTTGGTPKLALEGIVLEPKKPRELAATVAVRTGPRAALPTIDLILKLKAEPPKKDDEGSGAAGLAVLGRVESAKPSREQPGTLPAGVEEQIAKLVGSRLEYRLSENGALSSMSVHVPGGAEAALGRVVEGVGELASTLHVPFPAEPVGPGAYWMITSREQYIGLDVVAYRMFKVEDVSGSEATLSIATKRYVAGGQVTFPGLPKHEVDEFRGEGRGEIVVEPSRGIVRARVQDTLLSNLAPEGDPQRRITIQLDVTSTVTLPSG